MEIEDTRTGKSFFVYTLVLTVCVWCMLSLYTAYAATIQMYSDRISDSAPSEEANHTITFTTTADVPPGGFVEWTPHDGVFTIPVSDFDIDNVEMF